MKESEWQLCQENGVTDVSEVLIGYDGLTIAVSRQGADLELTEDQIFQALAAEVEVDGQVVANPYTRWNEIDPSLPDTEITVFGPPPTSGTRDAFVELVMHDGCKSSRPSRRSTTTAATTSARACAGRPLHRGRRERQPDRPAPAAGRDRGRHLRLLVPLREPGHAEAGPGQRRRALASRPSPTVPTRWRGRCSSTSRTRTATSSPASTSSSRVRERGVHRSEGLPARARPVSLPDAERKKVQDEVIESKTFTRYGS
jgi:hypothetical protein